MYRWIGETVVQLSLGAEDVPLPHCQCCLRLMSKCIWCLGAVAHWLVIVVGYLMIIFSVVFVMIIKLVAQRFCLVSVSLNSEPALQLSESGFEQECQL